MSIGSVGPGATTPLTIVTPAGNIPDPQARRAQVNAQTDLLQAVRGVDLSGKLGLPALAQKLSAGQGLDLYL